jgi:hypothetical protein
VPSLTPPPSRGLTARPPKSRARPARGCSGVMAEQATALGAAEPARLPRQLTLLYDGALAQSRLDRGPAAATAAKAAAQVLIDAASAAGRKPRARPARAAPRERDRRATATSCGTAAGRRGTTVVRTYVRTRRPMTSCTPPSYSGKADLCDLSASYRPGGSMQEPICPSECPSRRVMLTGLAF